MSNNQDLKGYAMGNEAKIVLADVLTKYLAPELVRYICNDFLHELLTAKAEALLGNQDDGQ
jgi:hypothetical protein